MQTVLCKLEMQIFHIKFEWLLFPYLLSDFFSSKSIGLELWANCVSLRKSNQKCKLYRITRNANSHLNIYFSHTVCSIFLKINRVEAIDEVDKLCKFHEKSEQKERLYHINKKKMDGGNHAMT